MEFKGIIQNLLVFVPQLLFLVAVIGGVVFALVMGIRALRRSNSDSKKAIIASVLCVLVQGASWFLNMGWFRFIMTFMLIPVIHVVVLFITNIFAAKRFNESKKLKIMNLFFMITFLLCYIFLPDGGDYGEMYFFFGLIKSNVLSGIAEYIAEVAFVIHLVLLILQIVEMVRLKKAKASDKDKLE